MSGTVTRAPIHSHLLPTAALRDRHDGLHFTDEEAEAQQSQDMTGCRPNSRSCDLSSLVSDASQPYASEPVLFLLRPQRSFRKEVKVDSFQRICFKAVLFPLRDLKFGSLRWSHIPRCILTVSLLG